jgi:hypothetical protein
VHEVAFELLQLMENEPSNGHMAAASIEFQDNDHFVHHWTWHDKGKDTPLALTLVRKNH